MSIPESVIEAAGVEPNGPYSYEYACHSARRVILALAESMPEDAVEKDLSAWLGDDGSWSDEEKASMRPAARRAIAAFLKHVAGDSP